jgi:hypothetical protein
LLMCWMPPLRWFPVATLFVCPFESIQVQRRSVDLFLKPNYLNDLSAISMPLKLWNLAPCIEQQFETSCTAYIDKFNEYHAFVTGIGYPMCHF